MSGLSDFAKKAEQVGQEHSDEVDKGIEEAEKAADERTGNTYEDQVKQGGDQLEKRFGGGQDQQRDENGRQPDQPDQPDQQQGR
jgi:hypothetical protein